MLTDEERARYARHLTLPEVGEAGQERLKAARVLVVGAGGLGSPASLYLAAAGVGALGLADFDVVDASNLQRQILYVERDVGERKLTAAAKRLAALNPHVRVEPHALRVDAEAIEALVARYDVVVDGTDNFATRYVTADRCALLGKPYVYGSVLRFEGHVAVFHPPRGPCYRCLFPAPPPPGAAPSCSEAGVLGVLPGLVGIAQATEALKLVLGIGTPLVGRLAVVDALSARWRDFAVERDPACAACGPGATRAGVEALAASAVEACATR
jgi:adenylyltransferase/sulfurtransferase